MKTISVQEIKIRLNEGVSDEELMSTYGLTPDQLNRLCHDLICALAKGTSHIHIVSETD